MTEFDGQIPDRLRLRQPKRLHAAVRDRENKIEELWREAYLKEHLFHDHVADGTLASRADSILLRGLEQDFMSDKRDKNMGERFELALSDKYLGLIDMVELGLTTAPGKSGEVDGLKHEYADLLAWMIHHGITNQELSRAESGRTIEYRTPVLKEARDAFVVMVRNRQLVRATIEHEGVNVDIGIAKRMVFSMPIATLRIVDAHFKTAGILHKTTISDETVLSFIEEMFLLYGSGGVQPIRTAYFLRTSVDS